MSNFARPERFATHGDNIVTCHPWLFINDQKAITHVRKAS
jgi:hypothetical protein